MDALEWPFFCCWPNKGAVVAMAPRPTQPGDKLENVLEYWADTWWEGETPWTISYTWKHVCQYTYVNINIYIYIYIFKDIIHSLFLFPRASERRVLLIVEVCHHIFSSHLHIFSSSHPHIFSYLLILTSSHLLIFTSSHIFSSSHLLTSSDLHIFSHLLIFTSSHIFSSSHLHTFSSSHLLTSSHLHIFSHLLSLALLPSCPLALFSLLLFYFSLKARGSANEAPRNATLSHEMRFDRQKLR